MKLAIGLSIRPTWIATIIDFAGAKQYGTKSDGNAAAASTETLQQLLGRVSDGSVEIPIARTFRLEGVRQAFTFLEQEHHRAKNSPYTLRSELIRGLRLSVAEHMLEYLS